MRTFIALADIHLGWKLFNLPELAQDIKDDFVRACNLAIEKKVDYLFIVGDLFDTNKPSPDLISFVTEQVRRLADQGILVAGIAGDHDKPVNGSSWIHLTGIVSIEQLGMAFIGYDYTDNSQENIDKLKALSDDTKKTIEWIFLHGQVPELFSFTEDKKKLDIKSLNLPSTFPALKGVILGDIHAPVEGAISDPTQSREDIWIGYCGSISIIKTDEIDVKEGILYFDGTTLTRLPFDTQRKYIRLDINDSLSPINWVEKYTRYFTNYKGKKPIFLIEYNKASESKLAQAAPLYEVGIVKLITSRRTTESDAETVNIRSELKTNSRIEKTLKECAQEQDVYDLLLAILNVDDPKAALDKFKDDSLTTICYSNTTQTKSVSSLQISAPPTQ
jgi:DNA repair exonuclease SbcCD nuclease subunit